MTEVSSIADEIQSIIKREEILHRNMSEGNRVEGGNEDKGVNNKLRLKAESVKWQQHN